MSGIGYLRFGNALIHDKMISTTNMAFSHHY